MKPVIECDRARSLSITSDRGTTKVYNIFTGVGQQLRRDVALNCMRPPLEQFENVEVFSKRQGGTASGHQLVACPLAKGTLAT